MLKELDYVMEMVSMDTNVQTPAQKFMGEFKVSE